MHILMIYQCLYASFRWRMKSVSRQPGDRDTFAMCKQERRKWRTSRHIAHVEEWPYPRSISLHGVSQISCPTAKHSNLNSKQQEKQATMSICSYQRLYSQHFKHRAHVYFRFEGSIVIAVTHVAKRLSIIACFAQDNELSQDSLSRIMS